MPIITIEGPRINTEKKRELARKITDIASGIYGIAHIIIIIKENEPENIATEGTLIADLHHERGESDVRA